MPQRNLSIVVLLAVALAASASPTFLAPSDLAASRAVNNGNAVRHEPYIMAPRAMPSPTAPKVIQHEAGQAHKVLKPAPAKGKAHPKPKHSHARDDGAEVEHDGEDDGEDDPMAMPKAGIRPAEFTTRQEGNSKRHQKEQAHGASAPAIKHDTHQVEHSAKIGKDANGVKKVAREAEEQDSEAYRKTHAQGKVYGKAKGKGYESEHPYEWKGHGGPGPAHYPQHHQGQESESGLGVGVGVGVGLGVVSDAEIGSSCGDNCRFPGGGGHEYLKRAEANGEGKGKGHGDHEHIHEHIHEHEHEHEHPSTHPHQHQGQESEAGLGLGVGVVLGLKRAEFGGDTDEQEQGPSEHATTLHTEE